jgi:hypothetical protein
LCRRNDCARIIASIYLRVTVERKRGFEVCSRALVSRSSCGGADAQDLAGFGDGKALPVDKPDELSLVGCETGYGISDLGVFIDRPDLCGRGSESFAKSFGKIRLSPFCTRGVGNDVAGDPEEPHSRLFRSGRQRVCAPPPDCHQICKGIGGIVSVESTFEVSQ